MEAAWQLFGGSWLAAGGVYMLLGTVARARRFEGAPSWRALVGILIRVGLSLAPFVVGSLLVIRVLKGD